MCKIIAISDEWPLSDGGYDKCPDADTFARNVAWWFAGDGKKGKFLAYSSNRGLRGRKIGETMRANGHTWTCDMNVPFTLETLQQYDGVFLAQEEVDCDILIEYCKGGGNVLVMGGTAKDTWLHYNSFLSQFGLEFEKSFDPYNGPLEIEHAGPKYHPIMKGVGELWVAGSSHVRDCGPGSYHDVFVPGVLGIYDYLCEFHSGLKDFSIIGVGAAVDDPKRTQPHLTSLWKRESLYHNWKEIIEKPNLGMTGYNPNTVCVKHHDGSLFIQGANSKDYYWRKDFNSPWTDYANGMKDTVDIAYEPWYKLRLWTLKPNGHIAVSDVADGKAKDSWWNTDTFGNSPQMPEKMGSITFGSPTGGGIVSMNADGKNIWFRGGWDSAWSKAKVGNIAIKGFCSIISNGFAGCGKSDGELYVRNDPKRNANWIPTPKFGIHIRDLAVCPNSSF